MPDKYLELSGGRTKEKEATNTSAGAADAGKIPALDSTGRLAESMMPVAAKLQAISVVTSETLAAGDFVNLWYDVSVLKARKADATTNAKRAHGFVESIVTSGQTAVVFLSGVNTAVSALTPGTDYYLATSPGTVTATPPSTSGNLVQRIGPARSATSVLFQPEEIATVA